MKAFLFLNNVLKTQQEDSNITPDLMRDGDVHQGSWQSSPSPETSAALPDLGAGLETVPTVQHVREQHIKEIW